MRSATTPTFTRKQQEEFYEISQVKFRFGKWQGYTLSQTPVSYLRFLRDTQQGDPSMLLDIARYMDHPLFAERERYEHYERATDIKPIPRSYR